MNLEDSINRAAQAGAEVGARAALTAFSRVLERVVIRPEDDVVLNLNEAAAFLQVSPETARDFLRGMGLKPVGVQWRVGRWVLRRFVDPELVSLDSLEPAELAG